MAVLDKLNRQQTSPQSPLREASLDRPQGGASWGSTARPLLELTRMRTRLLFFSWNSYKGWGDGPAGIKN
jgi:hypothetical protein